VIPRPDNSFYEEKDSMALNKGNKSLRELLAFRSKESTLKAAPKSQVPSNLPPPPPQIPIDLDLKLNPDPKKKRPLETLKEGEVGPRKGMKQQRVNPNARDRRSQSVESREEQNRADVRIAPRTWSPWLEVDGAPIPWNASVREFQRGQAVCIVEALEQPLLLPKDMKAYRCFSQTDLFMSLKRDLAMVNNLSIYEFRC